MDALSNNNYAVKNNYTHGFSSSTITEIKCPDLRAPKYGQVQLNSTVYDSKARYYCDHGYLLYGEEYRYCGYKGKWSGSVPTCKREYESAKLTHPYQSCYSSIKQNSKPGQHLHSNVYSY